MSTLTAPATTDDTAGRIGELTAGFATAIAVVPADGWDASSPCDGWTARDVVDHVISTERDFLTKHGVDLGDAPDLADPAGAWNAHAGAVVAALIDPGVAGRSFDGYFGPSTVGQTMLRFYG